MKKNNLFGIITGVLSIIFGIVVLAFDGGTRPLSQTYGGDAYTGIQNAAAATARNVDSLITLVKLGFGFLLIVIGLLAIVYFAFSSAENGDEKKSEAQAHSTRLSQSEPINTETTQKANDAMDKQCVEAEKKEKMPKRWNIPKLEPISKPDDFQSNPTWINELKSLDSKEIYKRYIDSYNWSDKHRYQCYLELMQRKQEASFEAQEDGFADDFFNITCPYCGEELSFLVGTTEATCPNCYHKIEDM